MFWGAIGKFFKKIFEWIAVAISVAIAVLTIIYAPYLFATTLKAIFGIIGAIANAASSVLNAFGLTKACAVLGIIAGFASFGTSFLGARSALNWKTFLAAVSSAATAASRTLSFLGHRRLGQIFGLVSTVTGFISSGVTADPIKDKDGKNIIGYKYGWNSSRWKIYKFALSSAEQIANIAGATRVGAFFNSIGIIDEIGDFYQGAKEFFSDKNNPSSADKVYKLDVWKNDKGPPLTGLAERNARFALALGVILRRSNDQVGRINRGIARVERGVALAR